jgi:hypothetical protein
MPRSEQSPGEALLQVLPQTWIVDAAGRQLQQRVQMIGHHDSRNDRVRDALFRRAPGRAKVVNVTNEAIRSSIEQGQREEIGAARDSISTVQNHGRPGRVVITKSRSS